MSSSSLSRMVETKRFLRLQADDATCPDRILLPDSDTGRRRSRGNVRELAFFHVEVLLEIRTAPLRKLLVHCDQPLTKGTGSATIWRIEKLPRVPGSMPRTFNIGEAKAKLSHLIARAEAGEEVVLARNGVPAARIVSLNTAVSDTIALMREERARRPAVTAAEVRAARGQGRT